MKMWWNTASRCSESGKGAYKTVTDRKEKLKRGSIMLGIKEIEEIIPHRHPFLLVDCIEELEPGVRAVGYKCVTFDEPYFRDISRRNRLCRAY